MGMVNPDLWKYGMTLIIGSLTVFFLCGAYVAGKYFQSSPQRATEDTNNFLTSQGAVRLAPVGAVAVGVCILSLFGVLNEGAIAILSGITGYVLGGIPAPIAKPPK